jgi:ZIP family zinc transporter
VRAVSVVFLALAAGSIIYLVTQHIAVATRAKRMDLLAGFITDAIVTPGGA